MKSGLARPDEIGGSKMTERRGRYIAEASRLLPNKWKLFGHVIGLVRRAHNPEPFILLLLAVMMLWADDPNSGKLLLPMPL